MQTTTDKPTKTYTIRYCRPAYFKQWLRPESIVEIEVRAKDEWEALNRAQNLTLGGHTYKIVKGEV